jgi:hypothetical protein
MFKNFARVLAAAAFVVAAAIPTTASAAGGGGGIPGAVSIHISPGVTVSGKQLLTVTVTQSCPLLVDFNGNPVTSQFGFVSVQEVRGNTIAHAFGSLTTVCDGIAHASTVTALAQNQPFHNGVGVAQASAFNICGMDPTTLLFECINGTATQAVTLRAN